MESMARNLRQTVLIEYSRDFITPITEGEIMGSMTYYPPNGENAVTYDLIATRSIARRANAPLTLEEIEALVYGDPNPFPPLSVELVMLLLLPVGSVALGVKLLLRFFRKDGKGKPSRIPKPKNRWYQ